MISRYLHNILINWKTSSNRCPLILSGARQVGKTTLVHSFSEEFDQYLYLNLEKPSIQKVFIENDEVTEILNILLLLNGLKTEVYPTLVFIDEIQVLPKAIQLLRYFKEELPHIHVIAAGSLLEFALGDVRSFPVGRVEFMNVYPLNFQEYLGAIKRDDLSEIITSWIDPKYAHQALIDLFNEYVMIGGMPEIVSAYTEKKDIVRIQPLYKKLTTAYEKDFEKYSSTSGQQNILRHLLQTMHSQVGNRITYAKFSGSEYRSREISEGFMALEKAGIVYRIYPTKEARPPVIFNYRKSPKLQFLDTGLLIHRLGAITALIPLKDLHDHGKGMLIEHAIIQEIISRDLYGDIDQAYWSREKASSQAEVDILYRHQHYLIPIEVKAGATGKLKSLGLYMDKAPHHYAIRMYAGKFHVQTATSTNGTSFKLLNLPYYLGTQLDRYAQWFVETHPLEASTSTSDN